MSPTYGKVRFMSTINNGNRVEPKVRDATFERSIEVRPQHEKSPTEQIIPRLKVDQQIKNHTKLSEINNMAIGLAKYNCIESLFLAYIL